MENNNTETTRVRSKESSTMVMAVTNGWEIVGRFIYNGQRAIRIKKGFERITIYPYLESYKEDGRMCKGVEERLREQLLGNEHDPY